MKGFNRVPLVLASGAVAIIAAAVVWVSAFAASPSQSPATPTPSHSAALLGGAHHKTGQPGLMRRQAEAQVLGITRAELQADFAKGMTLHQIADTKGVTLDQFTTRVMAAEKARLDAEVKAGKITQAQADQIAARETPAKIAASWDAAGHRGHVAPTTPATTG